MHEDLMMKKNIVSKLFSNFVHFDDIDNNAQTKDKILLIRTKKQKERNIERKKLLEEILL